MEYLGCYVHTRITWGAFRLELLGVLSLDRNLPHLHCVRFESADCFVTLNTSKESECFVTLNTSKESESGHKKVFPSLAVGCLYCAENCALCPVDESFFFAQNAIVPSFQSISSQTLLYRHWYFVCDDNNRHECVHVRVFLVRDCACMHPL